MRRLGRTTTLERLTFLPVSVDRHNKVVREGAYGASAALHVQWLERRGDSEILKSEIWFERSAGIWQVMSPKR